MPKQSRIEVGRLAMRVEGEWWNAYWAPSQTSMDGAILLASVQISAAQNPKVKAAFMSLGQEIVSVPIRDLMGREPDWNLPKTAPEHERSGSA